jgi:hypothetical protein
MVSTEDNYKYIMSRKIENKSLSYVLFLEVVLDGKMSAVKSLSLSRYLNQLLPVLRAMYLNI